MAAQEDHSISERLEGWGDRAFELLTDLLHPSISNRLWTAIIMETYSTANPTNKFHQSVIARTRQTDLLMVINEGAVGE